MRILGISSDFHDASAALLDSGRAVFSGAEERFSLQKHDSSFPSLAIDSALRAGGIAPAELDWVAYHEDPVMKFSRVLTSRLQSFPRGFSAFASAMRDLALGQLWVKLDIFRKVGVSPRKIRYVPHHLSHAAYAFATSPFDSAAILVLDAVGEWSSTTWLRARRDGGRVEFTPLGAIPYPHSLGMVYSAFTGFLGFRVNDGECSTMALAAFGQPRHADKIRAIVRAQQDGTYDVDPTYFDFSDPSRLPVSEKFLRIFGAPRAFRAPWPFQCGNPNADPGADAYYADIAASLQLVLEERVLALGEKLARESGEENLCLAGGVALNSTMTGRLIREGGFARLHVPPDPGDGGGALGAAFYLQSRLGTLPRGDSFSPYLGLGYDERPALDLVAGLNFGDLARHRASPSLLEPVRSLTVEQPSNLNDSVCADLQSGKIVGWAQGRFESGPRALGNRSLLADPANAATARRLSRSVKSRAAFRPYALSLSREACGEVFALPPGPESPALRWMSCTYPVKENVRTQLREGLHVDGTTRPQVVGAGENPRFHGLLRAWQSATGQPALLNTSFNESGYPMVTNPHEALLMFLRTDIDTLVLNDTLIRKRH